MSDMVEDGMTTGFFTVKEAAAHLGISPHTMNNWRVTGEGPPFYRMGKFIRYDRDELDAWMRSRRYNSTSEC